MIGIYFSGTGNTRHCVSEFLKCCEDDAKAFAIEDVNVVEAIKSSDVIVLGYPIYFSNLPKIVKDFLVDNKSIFSGKKVFIIATMGLFSGDGAGCGARLLKKYGAKILGGLHLKMPDCIGDEKLLKKTIEANRQLVTKAEAKIKIAAKKLKSDKAPREGLNFWYHLAGLFGQRLWFFNKTKHYSDKLKIDAEKCVACGKCVKLCPMQNLKMVDGKIETSQKCTMCYRCFSHCPTQAITLLGSTVHEQCNIEKYIEREDSKKNI